MTLPDNIFLRFNAHRVQLERGELPAPRHDDAFVIVFMSLLFSVVGSMGVAAGLVEVGTGAALRIDGQPVEAAQIARRVVDSDGKSYYITYTYTSPDGQQHTREGGASHDAWAQFCQGCPISARYVASATEISRLDTEWPLLFGLFFAGFTGIFAAGGLLLGAAWAQERLKGARRKRDGRLRLGTILDVTTREDSDNDLFVTLHYQLDGADAPQSFEWLDNSLRGRLPQPGARLAFSFEADDNLELL